MFDIAALCFPLLGALPVKIAPDTLALTLTHLRCHAPALRRAARAMEFDLKIEPEIYWGMTRPALENMVGIVEGAEYDFSYPVSFSRRFHPVSGILRESNYQVWFDTRWFSTDGDITHAHYWQERRTYSLQLPAGIRLPLIALPVKPGGVMELSEHTASAPYPARLLHDAAADPDFVQFWAALRIWFEESVGRFKGAERTLSGFRRK